MRKAFVRDRRVGESLCSWRSEVEEVVTLWHSARVLRTLEGVDPNNLHIITCRGTHIMIVTPRSRSGEGYPEPQEVKT